MKTWKVTLRTGTNTWSTIELEAANHFDAIRDAQRLLGDYPVTEVI